MLKNVKRDVKKLPVSDDLCRQESKLLVQETTGSFSKDVFSQGAEYQVFLGVFLMFLAFFHSKIWAKFHFGTFKPYD